MPWCSMRIAYGPTAYEQNYKRQLAAHSHALQQQFVTDALNDSLVRINNHLPPGQPAAQQNQLQQLNLAVQQPNDPGPNYRNI